LSFEQGLKENEKFGTRTGEVKKTKTQKALFFSQILNSERRISV